MSKLIKFALVLFLYANTLQAQSVHIKQGEILGFEKYGIKHFLGIPFAQAPIGNKRWQAPEWISNYQQPVDASKYGDICVQPNAKPEDNMSEDCLNLNIWTPSTKAKLPVMVWLHGGGFRTGSNRVLGTTFAAKGSVVVALNYRLGPLGFFAHPELNDKAANPGALDMVAGLQWVKQNIQYFGGDPENITLFGVSAGGMAVNLMVTNSKAKGLFHKAIAQSGYATWPLPRTPSVKQLPNTENAHVSAIKLIAKIDSNLTKDKQSIEVLQKLSALELVNAVDGFVLPIVDGHSVEEEPGVRFVKGLQNPVALMTGGNSFEGSVMPYSGMTESDYHVMLGKEHKNIKALYKEYDGLPQNLVNQLMWGDNRYLLSAQVTAKAMKKINQPSWLYYINFIPDIYKGKTLGTIHGSDAQMLWGGQFSENKQVKALSLRLQDYWFNFAKNGVPSSTDESATNWLNQTQQNDSWLIIGDKDKLDVNPIISRLNAFERIYTERINF